jgi:two-component system OmpR family sensor kinase
VGLGLSIVKSITDALHGRIELTSAVGAGSTFSVILPQLPQGAEARALPMASGES